MPGRSEGADAERAAGTFSLLRDTIDFWNFVDEFHLGACLLRLLDWAELLELPLEPVEFAEP